MNGIIKKQKLMLSRDTNKISIYLHLVKYYCDKCDSKITGFETLERHKQAVHEGVKYDCDKCDYKVTRLGYLKTHKQAVHGVVIHNCDICDNEATRLALSSDINKLCMKM